MPAVQTTYNEFIAASVPGMVLNQEPSKRITRVCQDVAGVAFGKAAFRGTAANQFTGTPAANKFLGITIKDVTQEADLYPRYINAGLLNEGVIAVTNGAAAVTHGDPVYVTPAGAFTNVDGGGANFAIAGGTFETSAAAGALVGIRLK